MLIFSGFAKGYSRIIEIIKEHDKDVIIKVLWHGSNALLVEQNDWEAFNLVLFLYKNGKLPLLRLSYCILSDYYLPP